MHTVVWGFCDNKKIVAHVSYFNFIISFLDLSVMCSHLPVFIQPVSPEQQM